MSLKNCYNIEDLRKLAEKKLPAPIFHYIDGGSDDEVTKLRNTEAFNKCDLVPIYIERSHKYFFKMYVSEPIVMNDEKSQDEISIHLNKILEKMILKNPDQWIWTHNRWK